MDDRVPLRRRRLLAGVAGVALTGPLAGCTGDDGSGDDGSGDDSEDDNSGSDDAADGSDGDESGDDTDDGSDSDNTNGENGDDSSNEDDSSDDTDDGDGEVPDVEDLDLREANVVDVAFAEEDGSFQFDVALHHDDGGEDGYANWWQVERLDGSRLGRRDLLHAHSQQPFTRSETIDVPDDVTCVVVRGHDQTHEYGGVAMLVNLDSGATQAVTQGSDPQSFDGGDCP